MYRTSVATTASSALVLCSTAEDCLAIMTGFVVLLATTSRSLVSCELVQAALNAAREAGHLGAFVPPPRPPPLSEVWLSFAAPPPISSSLQLPSARTCHYLGFAVRILPGRCRHACCQSTRSYALWWLFLCCCRCGLHAMLSRTLPGGTSTIVCIVAELSVCCDRFCLVCTSCWSCSCVFSLSTCCRLLGYQM